MSLRDRLAALISAIGADINDIQTELNATDRVVTVPTGTSGYETQPDGTLWVEYTP